MHLSTFFWEGVRRFHQTLKGVHGTKKKVKNPDAEYTAPDLNTALRIYVVCVAQMFITAKLKFWKEHHKYIVIQNKKSAKGKALWIVKMKFS